MLTYIENSLLLYDEISRISMNTNHQKLLNNFEILKLKKFKDYYPNYIELLLKNQKSLTEILIDLTEKEIEYQSGIKI
ncbi:hypothetical protein ACVQ92_11570 [Staphylococcus aureus]